MIFPTTKQEELASEKVFNGINWDAVVTSMNNKNTEEKTKLPENFSDLVAEKFASDEDAESRTAGKLPEALEQYKFKSADEKTEEEEEDSCDCGNEDCEKCDDKTEKKAARIRKIRFTKAEQLSAEALDAARESGDEDLVNAILAARKDRRTRLASKIEEADQEHDAKLAQRHAYRQSLVKQHMDKIAATKKASVKITVAEKKTDDGFKKVSSLNSKERKAFAEKALANGFPQKYIDEMLGATASTEVSGAETEVRELMASSLSEDTKRTAIASLVKTSSLSGDQISRCIKYWTDELGYDKEWAEMLFKTTYDKNPGGAEEKAEGAEA